MTEGEAAPAASAEQVTRNLLIRIVAALVLAPLAIAIAYAGGWLWVALVALAAVGRSVAWLTLGGRVQVGALVHGARAPQSSGSFHACGR